MNLISSSSIDLDDEPPFRCTKISLPHLSIRETDGGCIRWDILPASHAMLIARAPTQQKSTSSYHKD